MVIRIVENEDVAGCLEAGIVLDSPRPPHKYFALLEAVDTEGVSMEALDAWLDKIKVFANYHGAEVELDDSAKQVIADLGGEDELVHQEQVEIRWRRADGEQVRKQDEVELVAYARMRVLETELQSGGLHLVIGPVTYTGTFERKTIIV